ncbi:MAG: hypothetical protein ACJ8KO_10505, partial [Sulfurifustaceae bacterium]
IQNEPKRDEYRRGEKRCKAAEMKSKLHGCRIIATARQMRVKAAKRRAICAAGNRSGARAVLNDRSADLQALG